MPIYHALPASDVDKTIQAAQWETLDVDSLRARLEQRYTVARS